MFAEPNALYAAHPPKRNSKVYLNLELLKKRKHIDDSLDPLYPTSENAIHFAPPPNSYSENNLAVPY
jgi:hypothetical protein